MKLSSWGVPSRIPLSTILKLQPPKEVESQIWGCLALAEIIVVVHLYYWNICVILNLRKNGCAAGRETVSLPFVLSRPLQTAQSRNAGSCQLSSSSEDVDTLPGCLMSCSLLLLCYRYGSSCYTVLLINPFETMRCETEAQSIVPWAVQSQPYLTQKKMTRNRVNLR